MKRTEVKSSNLKSLGYDEDKHALEVEFQGGRLYTYTAVPKEVYDRLMEEQTKVESGDTDASVGKVFIDLVKKAGYDFNHA